MLFRASTAPEIFNMFFWNIIIVSAYHFIIFAICVKLPQSSFDENKSRYQMKKFERNGKFYKQMYGKSMYRNLQEKTVFPKSTCQTMFQLNI